MLGIGVPWRYLLKISVRNGEKICRKVLYYLYGNPLGPGVLALGIDFSVSAISSGLMALLLGLIHYILVYLLLLESL